MKENKGENKYLLINWRKNIPAIKVEKSNQTQSSMGNIVMEVEQRA
jgi:hypothetical protein